MISTTKEEVEKIQSKVETAKKIYQSYSCNECTKRMNIDNSKNKINNHLVKEKNKKYSIDESSKHLDEKNIENIYKNIENKKIKKNETSFSIIDHNTLNFPIIMIASSLMKDIREI